MKICWDNLENIYINRNGNFTDGKNVFLYKNSCKTCNEPYLYRKGTDGIFCGKSCATVGKNNPFFGKKHLEDSKRKIGAKSKGRVVSEETIKKISGRIGNKSHRWKGGYAKKNIPFYDTYAPQIEYAEEVRRNKKDKNVLEVKCAYCGKWIIPKIIEVTNRIYALKGITSGENRFYCDENCKRECPIYNQRKYPKGFKEASSREAQPELRQLVFKRDNYICQKCSSTKSLHCHHVEGIRWEPLESADIDKCITYCKKCHKEVHKKEGCNTTDMQCKEK